jgi:hypothetical protein
MVPAVLAKVPIVSSTKKATITFNSSLVKRCMPDKVVFAISDCKFQSKNLLCLPETDRKRNTEKTTPRQQSMPFISLLYAIFDAQCLEPI